MWGFYGLKRQPCFAYRLPDHKLSPPLPNTLNSERRRKETNWPVNVEPVTVRHRTPGAHLDVRVVPSQNTVEPHANILKGSNLEKLLLVY